MFDERANHQVTLERSKCLPRPSQVECCPRWTHILLFLRSQALFLSVHLLKSMTCRCKHVFFRRSEHSTICNAQAPLPYLFQLHSHNYTSVCIWPHLSCSFWPYYLHYHPLRSLFIIFLLFISSLSFSFLFTSLFHSALYSLCSLHPYLFWTVSAVLQGSVWQLTKRTVRSVIITVLHSFTPCLHTPSCRLPALSTLQEIVSWKRNKKKHRYESYLWVSKT